MADILIATGSFGVVERFIDRGGVWREKLYPVDVTALAATDIVVQQGTVDPVTGAAIKIRYQDQGDGTWAEVMSLNGE